MSPERSPSSRSAARIPFPPKRWSGSSRPAAARPASTPGTFQITTRNKILVPHVLAIPVGSTVTFPNDDPISHNLFSLSSNNAFDLGLYRKGAGKSQKFDDARHRQRLLQRPSEHVGGHPRDGDAVLRLRRCKRQLLGCRTSRPASTGSWRGTSRAARTRRRWRSPAAPLRPPIALTLDSRNYRASQHMDKTGKPYKAPSSREY